MRLLENPAGMVGSLVRLWTRDASGKMVDRGARVIQATSFGFGAVRNVPGSYDMIDLALVKDAHWSTEGIP